jgi:hypothetical protein
MESSKMRVLAATVLAGLLLAGGAVAPAAAESPFSGNKVVVTISGHVTDSAGKPIEGILVGAGCPCDGYSTDPHFSGRDHTSPTGFYSFKVQKQWVEYTYFSDSTNTYYRTSQHRSTTASGYRIDATFKRYSIISGTVTAINGGKPEGTSVRFSDPTTGKARFSAYSDTKGVFHARVKAGSYKVQFGYRSSYTNPVWYGGVATSAESPTVTVGYAKKVNGIDQSVTPKPAITGTFTVDGAKPLTNVSANLRVSLLDSTGAEVKHTVSRSGFSFVDITAGTYTIAARPVTKADPFVQPFQQTVTLAPDSAISGLVFDLTAIPPTATSTRSTGIEFRATSKGIAKSGKVLKGKIILSSYGSLTGGKLVIYVDGKKVDSRRVPASGRVNWRYRPTTVVFGKFHVTAKFFGTDTARSQSTGIYNLYGA